LKNFFCNVSGNQKYIPSKISFATFDVEGTVRKLRLWLAGLGLAFLWGQAEADYTLNLTEGVTELSRDVHDLHMVIFWICVAIGVLVYGLIIYSIANHRKSKGAIAADFHENTKLEIVWTVIPFLILIGMAIPATRVMIKIYDTSGADMTIKVTGYQWKWRYEYLDEGLDFFSTLDADSNRARQTGSGIRPASVDNYLLNVDKPLVLPTTKRSVLSLPGPMYFTPGGYRLWAGRRTPSPDSSPRPGPTLSRKVPSGVSVPNCAVVIMASCPLWLSPSRRVNTVPGSPSKNPPVRPQRRTLPANSAWMN
jgi:heme/copper-type cytochrome/quinol oxidase subunit 2